MAGLYIETRYRGHGGIKGFAVVLTVFAISITAGIYEGNIQYFLSCIAFLVGMLAVVFSDTLGVKLFTKDERTIG